MKQLLFLFALLFTALACVAQTGFIHSIDDTKGMIQTHNGKFIEFQIENSTCTDIKKGDEVKFSAALMFDELHISNVRPAYRYPVAVSHFFEEFNYYNSQGFSRSKSLHSSIIYSFAISYTDLEKWIAEYDSETDVKTVIDNILYRYWLMGVGRNGNVVVVCMNDDGTELWTRWYGPGSNYTQGMIDCCAMGGNPRVDIFFPATEVYSE